MILHLTTDQIRKNKEKNGGAALTKKMLHPLIF